MKKIFAMFCVVGMLASGISALPVSAEEFSVVEETVPEDPIVQSAYLIVDSDLWVSRNGSKLYINATTESSTAMQTIGFKNIVVEYSTDMANWYTFSNIPDITNSSATECSIVDYPVNLANAYYYRVRLDHYAKAPGLFGSSQTEPNTSNIV